MPGKNTVYCHFAYTKEDPKKTGSSHANLRCRFGWTEDLDELFDLQHMEEKVRQYMLDDGNKPTRSTLKEIGGKIGIGRAVDRSAYQDTHLFESWPSCYKRRTEEEDLPRYLGTFGDRTKNTQVKRIHKAKGTKLLSSETKKEWENWRNWCTDTNQEYEPEELL